MLTFQCRPQTRPSAPENASILELTEREYKAGFVTDIESETIPAGLSEDVVRLISAKKNEPEWLLEWRLKAYRHWLTMKEPTWQNVHYPPIDYQSIVYYSAPKTKKDAPKSLDEVDPKLLETYEKLGIPLRERAKLAGVAVDAVFDSVSVATTFREQLDEGRHHLLLLLRGGAEPPGAREEVPRLGRPLLRQLLRDAELRGLLRRLLLLHPEGRALPDGALDLLPDQLGQHRPVRAHADRRRGGRVRLLPRGLHGARSATRTSSTPRSSSSWRSTTPRSSTRPSRTGTPATRTARAASTTSSPSAAPAAARSSKISWTQVETGSAITWKYPSCILQGDDSVGEFYSVAVTNNYQQADTGTKMIHIGKNTKSTIVSKGISAGHGQNTYRGMVKILGKADGARNYSQCDSLLIGDKCGAHTFPYIEVNNSTAQMEHEASTSKIGEDQIFYFQQRGISPEEAVNMIVNGFCKVVFKELPMEFAVEAQKLLGVSLEGSVG